MLQEILRLLNDNSQIQIWEKTTRQESFIRIINEISDDTLEIEFEGWSIMLNEDGTWRISIWETGA